VGLGLRVFLYVLGLGFRIQGLVFKVQGLGFMAWGLKVRVTIQGFA
jgi:hypothetical protein